MFLEEISKKLIGIFIQLAQGLNRIIKWEKTECFFSSLPDCVQICLTFGEKHMNGPPSPQTSGLRPQTPLDLQFTDNVGISSHSNMDNSL